MLDKFLLSFDDVMGFFSKDTVGVNAIQSIHFRVFPLVTVHILLFCFALISISNPKTIYCMQRTVQQLLECVNEEFYA